MDDNARNNPESVPLSIDRYILLGKPERGLRTAAVVVVAGGGLGVYGLAVLFSVLRPGAAQVRLEGVAGLLLGLLSVATFAAAVLLLHELLHAVPMALLARRWPKLGWRLPMFCGPEDARALRRRGVQGRRVALVRR